MHKSNSIGSHVLSEIKCLSNSNDIKSRATSYYPNVFSSVDPWQYNTDSSPISNNTVAQKNKWESCMTSNILLQKNTCHNSEFSQKKNDFEKNEDEDNRKTKGVHNHENNNLNDISNEEVEMENKNKFDNDTNHYNNNSRESDDDSDHDKKKIDGDYKNVTLPKSIPIVKENLIVFNTCPIYSNYIIKERIGTGTWGKVHLAVERASGSERAVKKLSKRLSATPRFRQEMSFLKAFDHPNIVRFYEAYEDCTNIYLVMEYCRGGELFDRINRCSYFSESTAARLIHQILSAVNYTHKRHIVHRDLKPENFLFLFDKENSPIKLIDFGLATRLTSKRHLSTRVGTYLYMASEVLEGKYNEKSDLWSVGVILHILLSGTAPFDGETDAQIINSILEKNVSCSGRSWNKVSELAQDLVKRLLTRNPEQRLSATEALKHPWFCAFSPLNFDNLCMPRPISMPACLHTELPKFDVDLSSFVQQKFDLSSSLSRYNKSPYHQFYRQFSCHRLLLDISDKSEGLVDGTESSKQNLANWKNFPQNKKECVSIEINTNRFSQNEQPRYIHSQNLDEKNQQAAQTILEMETDKKLTCSTTSTVLNSKNLSDSIQKVGKFLYNLIIKWKRFASENSLKRVVLRIIAQHLSDEIVIERLSLLFSIFDTKHDGLLSIDGFLKGINYLHHIGSTTAAKLEFLDTQNQKGFEQRNTTEKIFEEKKSIFDKDLSIKNFIEQEQRLKNNYSSIDDISSKTHFSKISDLIDTTQNGEDFDVMKLKTKLTESMFQQLLTAVSLDGSECLDYSDYLAASLDEKDYNETLLKIAFHVFDRDGDGKIYPSDIRAVLGWTEVYLTSSLYDTQENGYKQRAQIEMELISIMSQWDKNKDGWIDYQEFLLSMKENEPLFSNEPN